ncbi:putative bifunctional diguanylate cyclase/phosphodiesterase [Gymnodinialimonas sp.]
MSSGIEVPEVERGEFLLALERAAVAAQESLSHLGLLLIDVSNLSRINHGQGYATGDNVLLAVYGELLGLSKLSDTVYRVSSHCYAFLLPELGNPALIALAINRVESVLGTVSLSDGKSLALEVNVGIAVSQEGARGSLDMLAMAESSLAHVKLGGDHQLDQLLATESDNFSEYRLEQYLADAIRENEFELKFQPQISLATGQLVGAEALLRWRNPDGDEVSPEIVVGMAERMGRSFELTKWVVHQAMRQLKQWQSKFRIGVALNVQAELVSNPDLASLLGDASVIWGVEPELVTVEITENAIIEDKEAGFSNLSKIRENGMKLSIDDFGTGYSSLSYFKHIPAAELKIDKSFVSALMVDSQDLELVKIMLSIAREFGLTVVAEGVEDQATLDLLRELGCDVVQGYHIARPMTAEAFEAWAESWPGV